MRTMYVSSALIGMCLMGCLGVEDGTLYEREASALVEEDPAALAAQPPQGQGLDDISGLLDGANFETESTPIGPPFSLCGWPPFCPENSEPIGVSCNANCYWYYGYDCFWGHNLVTCVPVAPPSATGTISATPENVPVVVGTLGTSTICWDVDNVSTGEVWVSWNGGAETLFARDPDGCQSAPWIQANNTYDFRLYAGTAHGSLLASVTVTGIPQSGGGNPGPCDEGGSGVCPGGSDCHCGDICRPINSYCP